MKATKVRASNASAATAAYVGGTSDGAVACGECGGGRSVITTRHVRVASSRALRRCRAVYASTRTSITTTQSKFGSGVSTTRTTTVATSTSMPSKHTVRGGGRCLCGVVVFPFGSSRTTLALSPATTRSMSQQFRRRLRRRTTGRQGAVLCNAISEDQVESGSKPLDAKLLVRDCGKPHAFAVVPVLVPVLVVGSGKNEMSCPHLPTISGSSLRLSFSCLVIAASTSAVG